MVLNKSPAFQWYPGKAIADMKRLSFEHKGIYRELLDIIWLQFQDTCSIPDDDEFIASELSCPLDQWQAAKAKIQNEHRPLLKLKTNRLFSHGLWKEAQKQEKRRKQLQENGKKGGRPRKVINQMVPGNTDVGDEKESLVSLSYVLSQALINKTSKALKRKLITTTQSTSIHIKTLLSREVTPSQIEATINWLCSENLKSNYRFDVQSGRSLLEKWDRIQEAMRKNGQSGVIESDPAILEYAKQWDQMLRSGQNTDASVSLFFRKARDNCGPDGVDRVKAAARAIPAKDGANK